MTPPAGYDVADDRRALVLVRAILADPRNPHLVPALVDYFERAERPREARLLAAAEDPLAAVAKMFRGAGN